MTTTAQRKTSARGRKLAAEFCRRVREALGDDLEAVVLYGSVARNEAEQESDIDVLVLTASDREHEPEVSDIRDEIDREHAYADFISPFVTSSARLKYLATNGFPIARSILREGIVLYDRGSWRSLTDMSEGGAASNRAFLEYHLAEAGSMLEDAALLLEAGRLGSAADRSYYAMFHACQAALAVAGADQPRTHSGLIASFGQFLVRPGKIESGFASDLGRAFEARQVATYGTGVPLEKEKVNSLLGAAARFVDRLRRYATEEAS